MLLKGEEEEAEEEEAEHRWAKRRQWRICHVTSEGKGGGRGGGT